MKGALSTAALAALAGSVNAVHRHGHDHLFARRNVQAADVCVPGCTTIYGTMTGAPTLVPATKTKTEVATSTNTITIVQQQPTPQAPVPTPQTKVYPTPGTYTVSATTVTLTQTTTVCAATSTKVPAGTHVVGGITTTVNLPTTVTAPVATIITTGGVTTSTIVQTEYVCPSAGTYTIAPITTTVNQETVIHYPVPTSYSPGTYVAPQKVVTVTETGYVYYCPFTSAGLPTSTPAPAPQSTEAALPPPPPPAAPTPEAPAVPTHEKVVPPVVTYQETPPALPAKPKQPSPAPPAAAGGLVSHNDHFGMTYTPYQNNHQCKSASQVDQDISQLKQAGFTTVRVYSTDCDTLKNVGNACKKHGVSMIVGIFTEGQCSYESPHIKKQVDELAQWDKWDLVKLVVVGNEAIFKGHCSPTQLATLITTVKSKCHSFKGPYTISETLNVWQRPDVSGAICGVVDVTGANIHPYFNPTVTPDSAGDFVASQLHLLSNICKGNEVINLECGWPTRGKCNGKACPGKNEQAKALNSIREKVGSKTVFFSLTDDLWKEAGECGCEQSWGSYASFSVSASF
ncbi:hypothetical protein HIM_03906 [Hirsutella minnesotensis 3608]|uniref:Probable beta-glucosidase btgE n=1 Tax=Hirsutella minnesotensis 3608 TaxID=1043627 RepID=A0A0F7ZQ37_9HYPO|nr:hypothetical protein HIM_03906 [Hirsutella minnesotensis 3608]